MKARAYFAEFLGTALLLLVVVGSGIMGERLSAGNLAVALLANALATGAGLFVLIQVFAPISGAHFNPVVSMYARLARSISTGRMLGYWLVQVSGALLGVLLAHFMFELPLFQISQHGRDGEGQFLSETIATFGLLLTIVGFGKSQSSLVPAGVAVYITGAYWFTSSTSFANPAVTIARMTTDTFSGIAPHSAPWFILAQVAGLIMFRLSWGLLRGGEPAS